MDRLRFRFFIYSLRLLLPSFIYFLLQNSFILVFFLYTKPILGQERISNPPKIAIAPKYKEVFHLPTYASVSSWQYTYLDYHSVFFFSPQNSFLSRIHFNWACFSFLFDFPSWSFANFMGF